MEQIAISRSTIRVFVAIVALRIFRPAEKAIQGIHGHGLTTIRLTIAIHQTVAFVVHQPLGIATPKDGMVAIIRLAVCIFVASTTTGFLCFAHFALQWIVGDKVAPTGITIVIAKTNAVRIIFGSVACLLTTPGQFIALARKTVAIFVTGSTGGFLVLANTTAATITTRLLIATKTGTIRSFVARTARWQARDTGPSIASLGVAITVQNTGTKVFHDIVVVGTSTDVTASIATAFAVQETFGRRTAVNAATIAVQYSIRIATIAKSQHHGCGYGTSHDHDQERQE